MFITKLGHSAVYVETPSRHGLFDPGGWADVELIDRIERVDRIGYTHEHADHFDPEILRGLLNTFPQAHVVCNQDIAEKIQAAGIQCTIRPQTACTTVFESPHEALPIPGVEAPSEMGFHFVGRFTHPGDSHSFNETKQVLAMPFIGPWGKTGDAVDLVLKLKPEYVLPIHDWHYTDEAREWLDGLLKKALEGSGITLLSSKPGIRHEIPD